MMINSLNDEQLEAITTKDKTILVSAPAGSGKTKILVSRIMSKLIDDRYDIDQLLVLTFTKPASIEMRQRLLFAIEDKLNQDLDPDIYEHLMKQKQKLPYSYITNFHSFCVQLLKKYGYVIHIPSQFEVVDKTEDLKQQAIDQCINQWLQDTKIRNFISLYFEELNFNSLKEMIFELSDILNSISNPKDYIQKIKTNVYEQYICSDHSFDQWELFNHLKHELSLDAIEMYNHYVNLESYASSHHITDFFEVPETKSNQSSELHSPASGLYDYVNNIVGLFTQEYVAYDQFKSISLSKPVKTSSISWNDEIKPYQSEFRKLKEKITNSYSSKAKEYLVSDDKAFKLTLKESCYFIEMMLEKDGLVNQFKQKYEQIKQQYHLLDFDDLQYHTIELLQPNYHVSELLYHQFKEIMIDEYQDTNQIQETIISLIKDYQQPSIITFMVGDMKQSIYRFRQADPQLFKDKYDTYPMLSHTKRIDLRYNYRSNKIVLDSINYIFNQIMDSNIGGLEYFHDISSQLNYDYLRKEKCPSLDQLEQTIMQTDKRYELETRFDTELLLVDKSSKGDLDIHEYEAHLVALRILDLIKNSTIDDNEKSRKIEYKDIVILTRTSSNFLTFKKVFDRYQIPNHIVLSQGFLSSVEIVAILQILYSLVNPYDNISMLSFIRGNYLISHFDENLIGKIRVLNKKDSLYQNMKDYCMQQLDGYVQVQTFLEAYQDLQAKMSQLRPSDFLEYVLQVTGYNLFVLGLINGEQRKANLDLLINEFIKLEADKSIYEIISYYQNLEKLGCDSSPAQVLLGSNNVVSFMTIHKSKGLEFPIVFVSNMEKTFNTNDSKKRMMIDKHLGIAIKPRVFKNAVIDQKNIVDQIVQYENPYYKLIARYQIKELINEEMRILYVALTRASQKLIMTGSCAESKMKEWQNEVIYNENPEIYDGKKNQHILLYYNARKVNNYLDWIGISLMRHPQVITQWLNQECDVEIKKNFKTIQTFPSTKNYFLENTKASKFQINFYTKEQLDQQIDQHVVRYPKNEDVKEFQFSSLPPVDLIDETIAVTKLQQEQEIPTNMYSSSPSTTLLSPAQKGTLVHSFLEHLPKSKDQILEQIETLTKLGLYTLVERDVLIEYQDKLMQFYDSECYMLINEAKYVEKEKPFSFLEENTNRIVHGVFDVLCFFDDKIVIIDYKTDRIHKQTSDHTLTMLHQVQMEYYKKIIQQIYPNYKVEAKLYYLEIGKLVNV